MKYSLTKKTILIIVCITVAISALALAIYDRGIYNLIVSQYGQRSGEITELVAVNVDSKQVSNLQKAVIDIYNNSDTKVMSDRWGTPEFEAYISQFESVKETEDYKAIRADLQCNNCGEIFELKTKKGHLGKKISDGAYSTMIERITSTANPDLLAMNYNSDYYITDLIIIPKFFFVPQIIEKRNPLAPTARRANWVGCNILYSEIPAQGKISIIRNSHIISVGEVTDHYNRIKKLQTGNLESRGWLLDVLNCVNNIDGIEFIIKDVYGYEDILQQRHKSNNNVRAKIRQQLQLLRDKGFIEFVDRGYYRKII